MWVCLYVLCLFVCLYVCLYVSQEQSTLLGLVLAGQQVSDHITRPSLIVCVLLLLLLPLHHVQVCAEQG